MHPKETSLAYLNPPQRREESLVWHMYHVRRGTGVKMM
jgi:hypothetical protein